jgi:uncharacterized lipoprotein YehR (DUF1307 family)
MKTLRFIGMAILAIIISVNFAACSDDDEDDNNPLIGTWINSEGNATMTWTFKANGTGVEKYDDNEAGSELHEVYSFTYTYDINSSILTINYGESDDHGEITEDIDKYTISINGDVMTTKDETENQLNWLKQ